MARALQAVAPATAVLAAGNEHLELWRGAQLAFRALPTYSGIATFGWHSLFSSRPKEWGKAISECRRKIVLEAMASPWSSRFRRWSDSHISWIPVIHDADIHPGLIRPWLAHLQDKIIRESFALATMSKYCADILIGKWGIPPRRIIQIRHGMLQRPEVRVPPAERARLRHRLLFFGRVEPYKGLEILVKAFRIAKSSCPGLTLTIAGRGDLGAFRREVDGQPEISCLNRYLSEYEVAELFSHHGVCLLPYTQATQSGVVALALGHGVPVIASRLGGLPEQVLNGRTGLLIAPANVEELSQAILDIAGNEEMAAQMAEETAVFADKSFGWGEIMRSFLLQLQGMMEDRAGDREVS
jgi:glycosyltransferase involved in cell wall biosynthesis